MKLHFLKLAPGRTHPLEPEDQKWLQAMYPADVIGRIRKITFRNNQNTTQLARLIPLRGIYDITVNFCLTEATTTLSKFAPRDRPIILKLGGQIDDENDIVRWSPKAGKLFALFLVAHEIAHILYIDRHFGGAADVKAGRDEERWCDECALKATLLVADRVS